MTSSTSNSNLRLLVTSMLVTCVTLVLGYHFLVTTNVIPPAPVVSPGDRIVQILDYATAPPDTYSVVLIGSSLLRTVARHDPDLPKHWFNLCLAGSSTTDGCDALILSGRYPKLVIAEVSDRLLVYEDGDSTAGKALVPWRVGLVKLSPMFNECYSPVAALLNRSTFNIGGVESRQEDRIKMKQIKIEEWNRNPTKYRLNRIRRLSCVLRDKLLQLKAHGAEVLIVPPPKDKVIENTKHAQLLKEIWRDVFPEPEYKWFDPKQSEFETADGGHLTWESSKRFSKMLRAEVQRLGY